jgi:hypothetical protein
MELQLGQKVLLMVSEVCASRAQPAADVCRRILCREG